MWTVVFYREAKRQFDVLDIALRKQIKKKLNWLAKNFDSTKHEALHGPMQGHYKLRVRGLRIIYFPNYKTKSVEVEYIDFRDKVYK